ncbi:MAG TPA: hypothetical protein VGL13_17325 [Polyangiaceae bacterium]
MSNHRSIFLNVEAGLGLASSLAIVAMAGQARAQACCAGTGAVTPGRLALHESALVGAEAKAASIVGHFDQNGSFVGSPAGAHELDFEQDLFGAVRVADRGQVALLVPFIETWRSSPGQSETGGGLGDVNASFRYDFTLAGASLVVPGISALAGITVPTGKPPEELAPTGTGAYQLNLGLAIEQSFGPWLVNLTGVVAQRTARTVSLGAGSVHERLAPQWTALAAVAYVLSDDKAVALSASYALEGDATTDGIEQNGTGRRLATLTLSSVLPFNDLWRLQGGLFDDLPISHLGSGQIAGAGLFVTLVRSWI